MSEENNNREADPVKTEEKNPAEDNSNGESVEDLKNRIAELEEVAKNKAIEARIAKKETKSDEVSPEIQDRLTRIELKDKGLNEEEIELIKGKAKNLNLDPLVLVNEGLADGVLAAHRKAKADEAATPSSQSRANVNTKDSVDYWIAKGELPPSDQVELRQKVVRKKRENAKKAKMFNYEI